MDRKAKSFQLILLLVLVLAGSLQAQVYSLDDVNEPEEWLVQDRSTLIYLGPGSTFTYHLGYQNMGDYLNAQTGEQPRGILESMSVGIGWRKNRRLTSLLVGIPLLENYSTNRVGNFDYHTTTEDFYAELTMGYAIISTDRRFVFLKGGIGLAGRTLQVRRTDNNPFNFDNAGIYTGMSWPKMEHFNGIYTFAVEMMPRPLRKMSVINSVQLGYMGGIGSPRWSSPEANLVNPMTDRVSAIFLRINVAISMERKNN